MNISAIDPLTPVLVGTGVIQHRESDWQEAREPLAMMLEAVRAAGEDCGRPDLLSRAELICVPRGRWQYRNPGGAIARAIGAPRARSLLSSVGVLQQGLIAQACQRIAAGTIDCAIVTGADAGYRLLRARLVGVKPPEAVQDDDPDELLTPAAELRHSAELAAGMTMPVGLYAILESAARAKAGLSPGAHRDRMAEELARFSRIAADNPHAWDRVLRVAGDVREDGPGNRMQAFPYTKAHCSSWNVDQGAALLLTSVQMAREYNIPRNRWVFPLASAESNHMLAVSERAELSDCPGARLAGEAALAVAGLDISAIDLFDLYSCFPIAVRSFAAGLGIPDGRDLTLTGGMNFAGGPYNNYFFQATARAAELLRAGAGRTALLSCVSGILTKQAVAIWSTAPGPIPFQSCDVSAEVARQQGRRDVLVNYSGPGTVAGCTVLYGRGSEPKAVVLIDTPGGQRSLATTADAQTVRDLQMNEWVGRVVNSHAGELSI